MHDTEKKLVVCVIVQRGGDDQLSRIKKKKLHVQKNDWNGVNFLVLIICSI